MQGGRLHYAHNRAATEPDRLSGDISVEPGPHEWSFEFAKTGEHRGRVRLVADGAVVAEGFIKRFTPGRFSLTGAGVTCGYTNGLPVADDVDPPSRFTGTIEAVTVEVDGVPFVDPEEEADAVVATQ